MKDSNKVREAYSNRDGDASREQHMLALPVHQEKHKGGASEYVKSLVFGALDGITTAFAVVTAAAGSHQSYKVVLVFGFANVLADGWSMGFGEYVSGRAELDHARAERDREEWEVENCIEGEKKEMLELYKERGFDDADASKLVDLISKNHKFFVDIMMAEELDIHVDMDEGYSDIFKSALVMYFSFLFFGSFPLFPYLSGKGRGTDYIFGISCGVTAFSLLLLGAVKGYLTSQPIVKTAILMLIAGSTSGGVSYAIGALVNFIVTGDPNGGGA